MMHLYLDTEFTDLVPYNKLISIALVDETGDYFYAELTDTYSLDDCSEFVKSDVLPILRGEKYQMTSHECALKMGNWVESRKVSCILACDSPGWDLPHVYRLLGEVWPANLKREVYSQISVPMHIEEDIVLENRYDVHNALDDALVMMKAEQIRKGLGY